MTIPEVFGKVDLHKPEIDFGIAGVPVKCEGFNKTTRSYDSNDPLWESLVSFFEGTRYTPQPQEIRIIGDEDQKKVALLAGVRKKGERFLLIVALDYDPQDIQVKLGSNYRRINVLSSVCDVSDCLATEKRGPGQITIDKQDGQYMIDFAPGKFGSFSTSR
jgi:hypothetical protein